MRRSLIRLIFVYGCVSLVTPSTTITSISMDEDSNDTAAASYELYNGTNCENFLNVVNSSIKRCVNQEEFVTAIYEYIYPRPYEWLLIAMHCFVFVVGLVGNFMVCMAIYRNHTMRNVTNYFIVNLAVADLLVIIVCLPPTVVWDVTETWFFGMIPCKIVLYFQTVSVTVSVLTLAFISLDRWYAICYPLRFKSTTSRAKSAIVVIWVIALVLDIPELVVLETIPVHGNKTHLMTQCTYVNMTDAQILGFIIFKFVVLYVMPLAFIIFAYCQIIRVLWRSDIPGHNLSTRMLHSNEITSQANIGTPAESQLKSRRKASKMLVAVVLLFAVCCFPVHLMGILRYTINFTTEDVPIWVISSCIFHWLLYLNSAINPVIYNFMSGKFRQEFKRTFCCPSDGGGSSHGGGGGRAAYRKVKNHHQLTSRSMRTTCSNFNIRTNTLVNCNNNFHLSSEAIPLSTVCVTTAAAAAAANNQQHPEVVQQNCFKER